MKEKPTIPEEIADFIYDDKESGRDVSQRMEAAQDDEAMLQEITATEDEAELAPEKKKQIIQEMLEFCDEWIKICAQEQRYEDERRWLQAKHQLKDNESADLERAIDYFIDQKSAEFDQASAVDDRAKCEEIRKQLDRLISSQHKVAEIK